MKRLGKYTGKIYTEDKIFNMEECGVCITDEQAEDEEWISIHHLSDLIECIKCCGCPTAQFGIVGGKNVI